jgi:hypothetical protein
MTQGTGIVGRAESLRRLDEVMCGSAEGRRSAVFVSGEAGMGKTSLIREGIDAATTDPIVVGWGTCWHGEGAPGFWPWMQAFDDLVRAVGLDEAGGAAGHDRDRVSLLVRDIGPAVDSSGDPDQHRLLLLDAGVRWLEALAMDRHVVIVLDDLHWADSSTLDLLEYVVSAPTRARLLVIGAYRHDELGHDGQSRLAALGAQTHHIRLEGLTVDEVEVLAGAICGPTAATELAEDLHRRTGGHPMFVKELARLSAANRTGPLPTVVTAAVARRLDTLPVESRRLLEVASVLGNRLLPDVLGLATDESPGVIVHRLGPTITAGLVRSAPGGELWFTHDIFRETLYTGLDAADRSGLHGRIGDALEARHARGAHVAAGDLARHFTRAMSDLDPARAIRWATEAAADERHRLAFTEAAGHLRRVREAAADAGCTIEPAILVRLLMDEAENQARSGDPDLARTVLARAASIAPGPCEQADVALAVQRLGAKFSAPRNEIINQLESALVEVTGVDLTKQAQVTAALARELQHSVAEDRVRAAPLSEDALLLGRQSNDDETFVACLLARHDALWVPGTGIGRAQLGHEIADVGGRLGDVDRTAEGLLLEANGLLESGSAAFRPVLDRWFGLLETRDEPRDRYLVQTRRAALALLEGDGDRAEVLMRESARIGEQIHEPDTGNVLMSQRVALAGVRNDPDELRALAVDAVRWWTGAPVLAHAVAAGAFARAGDLDAAAAQVAMVSESGRWQAEGSYLRSVLVMHVAEAAAALGDRQLCRTLLDDIGDLTDSCGVNGAIVAFAGPFAHTAGILAGVLDDHDRAIALLHRSIETARRLGATVWVREGLASQRALTGIGQTFDDRATDAGDVDVASLVRTGKVWHLTWRGEHGSIPDAKGLADIAALVRQPGREISALELAGGGPHAGQSRSELIDIEALRAYRNRLQELDAEIERADDHADVGRVELLGNEREQLLSEIRRATGLGGQLRPHPSDPTERARKAVSARLRDAITRLHAVAPLLSAHLDRSIHTGLRCVYRPASDEPVRWHVRF